MAKATDKFEQDDVDRIVDALVADPTQADQAKQMLRTKLTGGDKVRVAYPVENKSSSDSADDLWDNVPV